MLRAEGIQQYYGGSHILRDVSVSAQPGRITVLLGRNGVGKTSLLKSLMGLVPIRAGTVTLAGEDISRATPYQRARAGIGYVPQGREIFARLTVEENLRMGLASKPGGTPVPAHLYELFPVLRQMLRRRGGDLSGGQQQQLAIARALAASPQLLILDEPTRASSPASSRTSAASSGAWPMKAWMDIRSPSCCVSSTTTSPPNWPMNSWCWNAAQ